MEVVAQNGSSALLVKVDENDGVVYSIQADRVLGIRQHIEAIMKHGYWHPVSQHMLEYEDRAIQAAKEFLGKEGE